MRNTLLFGLTVSLLVLLSVGCETVESVPPETEESIPSFAQVEGLLIERGCAEGACHSGNTPKAGLNLAVGEAFASLVNQPCSLAGAAELGLNLVTPGEPDESFLYVKVTLSHSSAVLGSPMPVYGEGLTVEDTETIRLWIEGGALP